MNYTLSNQAIGALMMALQKSLLEQSDIVPVLQEFEIQIDDSGQLVIMNPPTVQVPNPEGETIETSHGMSETQERCLRCDMVGLLVRVPQLIQKPEIRDNTITSKDNVISAIEENRETLNKMKIEGRPNDFN
mgnify:CR=1 FL=1